MQTGGYDKINFKNENKMLKVERREIPPCGKMKSRLAGKKYLFVMIILLLTAQLYSQTKSVKVLLDDGTTKYYPVGEVNKLTFEDDACDGVRTITYASKTYSTVQIGTQCWLAQNLDLGPTIHSTSGGTNGDGEQTDNGTIERYCYDNYWQNCNFFGGLYQWNEAMNYSTEEGAQGICPSGWHIPTLAELNSLITDVTFSAPLISVGQGTGNNNSGFSALLVGYRYNGDGIFYGLSGYTHFWISKENLSEAYYTSLQGYNNEIATWTARNKSDGLSVRCIKN